MAVMTVWGKELQHTGLTEDSAERHEMTEQHVNRVPSFLLETAPALCCLTFLRGECVFSAENIERWKLKIMQELLHQSHCTLHATSYWVYEHFGLIIIKITSTTSVVTFKLF